ncbi:MAG: hypothetical protein PHY16_20105 [Methylobacter sp.]|nr:hypothetical protein [Methylobacter sp.]
MTYSPDLISLKRMLISGALLGSFLVFTSAAQASTYNFTTLDFGMIKGINNSGQLVGNFSDVTRNKGFVYNGSTYSTFDVSILGLINQKNGLSHDTPGTLGISGL